LVIFSFMTRPSMLFSAKHIGAEAQRRRAALFKLAHYPPKRAKATPLAFHVLGGGNEPHSSPVEHDLGEGHALWLLTLTTGTARLSDGLRIGDYL
jgi:hypothetical protein